MVPPPAADLDWVFGLFTPPDGGNAFCPEGSALRVGATLPAAFFAANFTPAFAADFAAFLTSGFFAILPAASLRARLFEPSIFLGSSFFMF